MVFTTDLIYLRLALALAFLKSAKADCSNLRKSVGDLSVFKETTKKIRDRLLYAALRVFRLRKAEQFIYYGLYDSIRIFELNHNTLHALDQLMRLNLASVLLMLSFSDTLTPEKINFILPLCQRTLLQIAELKKFLVTPFTKTFATLIDFLDIAECFYRCMGFFSALKLNDYEDKGLMKRTKDQKRLIA